MRTLLIATLLFAGATAAQGDIYTWKDARGTVFYTNSINEIPARYLSKARVLDVATGKKGGLATAQPATTVAAPPGGTAAAAQAPAAQPSAVTAPETTAPVMPALRAVAPNRQTVGEQRRMRRARSRDAAREE